MCEEIFGRVTMTFSRSENIREQNVSDLTGEKVTLAGQVSAKSAERKESRGLASVHSMGGHTALYVLPVFGGVWY